MNKKLIKVSNALLLTEFKHIFRVMKLTSLFGVLCVSSAFAINVNSQSLRVNIHANQKQAKEVIKQIEEQTDYLFVYNHDKVNLNNTVTIQANNETVAEVLNQMFAGTDIIYAMQGNNILLMQKDAVVQQSGKVVTGTIVDPSGMPVIGANVMVKGTTNGTITDMDGKFSLEVEEGATLQISYIGYANQEIKVGNQKTLSIALKEDAEALDELVVVGYGTTSVKKMVSAVTSVNGEKFQGLPESNLTSSLQGRVSGVIIQNQGGEPGRTPKVSIRGGGTPLYVIDGIISSEWDFQMLNPNDVESLSVLKDASSLAVYGSRAADGIVLVKTKEGHKSKTSITYSFNAQYSQPAVLPKKIDAYDYAKTQNFAAMLDGVNAIFSEEQLNAYKDQTDPFKYPNTNWYNLGLKSVAPEYRHSISINGNQKNLNYYVSLGTYDQGSLYTSNALNYNRYTLKSNVNTSFEELGLKVGLNVNGAYEKKHYPSFNTDGIWDALGARSPIEPAYNSDGTYTSISDHPLMMMDKRSGYMKNNGMFVNTQLYSDWNLPGIKGLSLGAMINYRLYASHMKNMIARAPQYNGDGSLVDVAKPRLTEGASFGSSYDFEVKASFLKTFKEKHTVDAVVVFTASENEGADFQASRKDYLSSNVDQLFAGSSIGMTNTGNASEGGRMGVVSRLKYDYASRYYIEGSFRYDGSDNFAPGYRWGFFPSLALAWDISEEPFFRNLEINSVNLIKIRGSYGQIGTEAGVNRFGYLPTYSMNSNVICIGGNLLSGFDEGELVEPEFLSWYTRDSYDWGIDYAFLNYRLKGTVDYFFYVTKGGLMSPVGRYITPLGKNLPQIKSDSEHRREGFEFSLRWNDKTKTNFTYDIGVNMLYYNNLWVKNEGEPLNQLMNPYQRNTHHTDFYTLCLLDRGLYQDENQILSLPRRLESTETAKGDIIYQDVNGDGKIDVEDNVRYGMPTDPHFTYGFDFNFSYEGFSLSGLFYGTGKRCMTFGAHAKAAFAQNIVNEYQMDYWRPDNVNATFPRISLSPGVNGGNNQVNSSFYIKNASFFRLKNLSLTYDLKYKLLDKINWISTCRISLVGSNLFTLSRVAKYWDPETTSTNGGYPVSRVYSLGLTVGF